MKIEIPVHDERHFDLIVAGGGLSGVCSAIAAAREGLNTALIERYGYLGGAATVNIVGPIQSYFWKDIKITGGIADSIVEKLQMKGGSPGHTPTGSENWPPYLSFDPEILKKVLDEMIIENKVNLYFHTDLVWSIKENNKISGVLCNSKEGLILFKAPYFVDATGDADLIWHAGGDFLEDAPGLQAMGMIFRLGCIEKIPGESAKIYLEKMRKEQSQDRLSGYRSTFGFNGSTIYPDEVSVNITRIKGNPMDIEELTRAEIEGREQVSKIVDYYRKNIEEYKNCRLIATGSIGVRESRRIKGKYVLNEYDVLEGRRCYDTIALGGWLIDIHGAIKVKLESLYPKSPYGIPYRCLIPEGFKNILVVGRAISCSHLAHGSVRVMPTCMAVGEAGGIAAAMAYKNNINVDKIDVESLRKYIKKYGGIFDC